jgi:hypothetical protein
MADTVTVTATSDPKSILESKTFWGLVIALAMPTLAKHGIIVDPSGMAGDFSTVIGGVLAVYGRLNATGPVKLV